MSHSSIETLEPRWAPARLVAGPLPTEFGVDLPADVPELEELVVGLATIEPPEFDLRPSGYGGYSYSGYSAQLVAHWAGPDLAKAVQFIERGERHTPSDFLEKLSPDRRETLAAYLAAGGELGEMSGSLTFFNRAGRA
jgi:hypothetical protein